MRGIPQDRVTTSMTINAPASVLLLLYELAAERKGIAASDARRHDPERHPQGIRGARNLHLSAAPSMRLVTDTFAYCAERLPRWNTISISGYHIREAGATAPQEIAFTLSNGIAYVQAAIDAGLDVEDFAPATELLLQRQQRLLRGGCEVSRRARPLGRGDARALRRDRRAQPAAAIPCADERRDAHGAAAAEQRGARLVAGARRGVRRRAVAAHQQLRRGARAAFGTGGGDRAAHPAGDRPRDRCRQRHRSDGWVTPRRVAHPRAHGGIAGADGARRRAWRRRGGDRSGLLPGADPGIGVPASAPRRIRGTGHRRRQPVHRDVATGGADPPVGAALEAEQIARLRSCAPLGRPAK